MEEQWLVAIESYAFRIQLVRQVILLHLCFAYMRSVGMVCKAQRMVVVAPILLDEFVCLANFDSDGRIDIITATFFKVESTKVGGKDVHSHGEDTYFFSVFGGAGATADSILI